MSSASRQAVDPDQDATVSRDLLAEMDDAATSREHWKILITSGMGFFTDAYDLFIIGVVAAMIVYPVEIFPVRVRTTSYGIAAAAGKIGAFIGTYALVALLPAIGLGRTSAIVAGVALLGLVVTLTMLPEPKGTSLEDFTERRTASSAAALGVAASRGVRPPSA